MFRSVVVGMLGVCLFPVLIGTIHAQVSSAPAQTVDGQSITLLARTTSRTGEPWREQEQESSEGFDSHAAINAIVFAGVTLVIAIVVRFSKMKCPKCGKELALRATGYSRPREESSHYRPRQDDEWECKFCGHKVWKKKPIIWGYIHFGG